MAWIQDFDRPSTLVNHVIITARKRNLRQGNVFIPVCHSVHRGEVGFPAGITGHITRGSASRGGLPPGGSASRGVCLQGGLHQGSGQTPTPEHYRIRSTSGRYASYWNAFLFEGNDINFPVLFRTIIELDCMLTIKSSIQIHFNSWCVKFLPVLTHFLLVLEFQQGMRDVGCRLLWTLMLYSGWLCYSREVTSVWMTTCLLLSWLLLSSPQGSFKPWAFLLRRCSFFVRVINWTNIVQDSKWTFSSPLKQTSQLYWSIIAFQDVLLFLMEFIGWKQITTRIYPFLKGFD